jgi:DNA adenine methylase
MTKSEHYPGSKAASGVYQSIINLMPRHDIYIEPFLGSGYILKNKDAASLQLGLDIDRSCIDKIHDTGHGIFIPGDSLIFLDTAATFINAIHELFGKILIYADPPYLIESRKSQAKIYKHEFTRDHHVKFLDTAVILKCFVMISCYDNDLYRSKLKDWSHININTVTRSGKAIETVYFNFPQDTPKHQYNFLGKDFRERAAIKGRITRNVSKIMRMPYAEQQFFLRSLSEKIKL